MFGIFRKWKKKKEPITIQTGYSFKRGDVVACIPMNPLKGYSDNGGLGSGYKAGKKFTITRIDYGTGNNPDAVAFPTGGGDGVYLRALELVA